MIIKREEFIEKICKGQDVLDVGCADHDTDTNEVKEDYLHKRIKDVSKSLLGLDLHGPNVKYLKGKGYDVVQGNVETVSLKKKFDVIIAGEIIEHLSNQGQFLSNMAKHLKPEGRLILTTPNGYGFRYLLRMILFGKVIPNPEHTCIYDPFTIRQILERHGFKIKALHYYLTNYQGDKQPIKYFVEWAMSSIRSIYAPQMLVVCSPVGNK